LRRYTASRAATWAASEKRIAPGAFAGVLDADVRALLNHDPNAVLGRSKAGTLRLHDEQRGLRFECDLPDSPLGENVREAVRRGDIDGASFRFKVGDERWDGDLRTVTTVEELHDVTVATYGAYPAASVELRTRPEKTAREHSVTGESHNDAAEQRREERTMDVEDRQGGGGLAVEDRQATTEQRSVEQRLGDALREVRKGESRALTTAAAVSPGELSTVLFDRLRAASVVLSTGIPVLTTDADSVTYPRLTADVAPAWTAEAAAITPGDPTFDTLTATPRKLAHLVQFSNEVLDDSDPSIAQVLNDHLMIVLALKLDQGLLEGSGTPPEIRGIKNISGTQALAAATNGQQPTFDNVADAIALLEAVNVPTSRMALIVHPRNVATLRKAKASTAGTYLWSSTEPAQAAPQTVFGVPVYTTPQLSTNETEGTSGAVANSAYLIDTQSLVYVQRSPIEVELDRSRLFNSDQSEMRAKLRGDLISPNPTGIVRIRGFLA
jgi:HK97 family phage major capsid protein/HK97 family phage prohead protease